MSAEKVTIADVARTAGVSKGLVSFALNNRPGVGATTRLRILQVAQDLGWKPSLRTRVGSASCRPPTPSRIGFTTTS